MWHCGAAMDPLVSILIPTVGRTAYLDVALGSVPDGARELIVVHDGPEDPATRAVCERHGATLIVHGERRGINVARNRAIDAASAPLLAFLDDDVRCWPGWLDALLEAARTQPDVECFGGPIRVRFEGPRRPPRLCGREEGPITELDLGEADRDAAFAWGANMAIRRSALERVGRFDPGLADCGDEEDWQRRLRAAGGRVRYVAAAGVDHRRDGDDVRVRALARAAWFRGRAARRYDAHKGSAPPLARELRVLAGTAWHTLRRRCGNGPIMFARSAGRIRQALADRRQ